MLPRGTTRPCTSKASAVWSIELLAAGLMAPGWAVGIFVAVWLVLFGLGCYWIRRKPLWVVPLPFIAAAIWLGGMSAGGAWLGWTA
jgi:hypothetical protein